MPHYTIPEHPGHFRVVPHYSGQHYLVSNDKTGKNQLIISVGTKDAADQLSQRLNAGRHNGTVSTPSLAT
jgi:hypothetical protein